MRSIRKAVQERLEEKQREWENREKEIQERKGKVISLFIDWVATTYDVDISPLEISASGDDQFYLTIKVEGESVERQEKAFLDDNGLLLFENDGLLFENETWRADRYDNYITTNNLLDAIIYAGGCDDNC